MVPADRPVRLRRVFESVGPSQLDVERTRYDPGIEPLESRSHRKGRIYSSRSATTGSTRVARSAGSSVAASATIPRMVATAVKVAGSVGRTA
jgi:hypothetical protein